MEGASEIVQNSPLRIGENSNPTNPNHEISDQFVFSYVDREIEVPVKQIKLQVPLFIQRKSSIASWIPVEKPNRLTKLGIESVCPSICFFYLRDECIEGENCFDSHELPSADDVRQKLLEVGVDNVGKLFRIIIARCPKLLHQYFKVFVDFFVEHQLKNDLITTIPICERQLNQTERFEYFKYLINAFIRAGDSYTTAMHTIFFNLTQITLGVTNTLLNMNLVDGVSVDDFLGVFHSLLELRYHFHFHIINRLMYLCTQSESALSFGKLDQFAQLIYGILKRNTHAQRHLKKDCYECFIQLYSRIFNSK